MKKLLLVLALVSLSPLAARAQNGCVNSPENPTALLALVGSAGAAFTMFRNRRK